MYNKNLTGLRRQAKNIPGIRWRVCRGQALTQLFTNFNPRPEGTRLLIKTFYAVL